MACFQVKSNVSALQMEEVTPAAVSNAQMLAPEEIFDKNKVCTTLPVNVLASVKGPNKLAPSLLQHRTGLIEQMRTRIPQYCEQYG
jgi:hypothetical protein